MPQQQLRVADLVAQREVETEVVRNVGIPTRLPAAERVVSANARVEITDVDVESGFVVINGLIRATVYYASADDPSNVVSIRRNFEFTDRVAIRGARPGLDADVDAIISDIDFSLINDRLIGIEFTVVSDIELTAPDVVRFIEERPGVEIRRQRFTIRRELQERNFERVLESVERLPSDSPAVRSIVDVNANPQIASITTDFNRVTIRGSINNEVLYVSTEGRTEFVNLRFPFNENFPFRGVEPGDTPFVEITVLEENAEVVDNRRIRKTVRVNFRILVAQEEIVEIPTEVITPGRFPVRRTVLVERVVAEERTRILASDQVTVPEGNPDVQRVIRATGRIRGGTLTAEARRGGVIVSGIMDANVLYVADLPDQPVFFTSAAISFSSFIEIAGVTADMDVIVDAVVERATATRVSDRQINVRGVIEIDLLVTETVRVPVVTGIRETPVEDEIEEEVEEGFITYTVQSGDTLYLIAQRYGVSVNRLIQVNNIANPNNLQVGQRLLIPR